MKIGRYEIAGIALSFSILAAISFALPAHLWPGDGQAALAIPFGPGLFVYLLINQFDISKVRSMDSGYTIGFAFAWITGIAMFLILGIFIGKIFKKISDWLN
jgi:hypothetical protein